MRFDFVKMQACGNDFILFDSMNHQPPKFAAHEIRWICDRHFGIGADGLVVLTPGERTHASWTFYNSDGSEAEMCGNAARCVIAHLHENHFPEESPIALETKAGVIRGRRIDRSTVELALFELTPERSEYKQLVLAVGEYNLEVNLINTGVPHAVIEVKDITTFPIEQIGSALVRHEAFGEQGSNITFYQRVVGNRIRSTTFERGVEKETFACGTGVAAAALVYSQTYMQQLPVEVLAPGGELLVDVSPYSKMLLLTGRVEHVFNLTLEDIPNNFEQPVLYSLYEGGKNKSV